MCARVTKKLMRITATRPLRAGRPVATGIAVLSAKYARTHPSLSIAGEHHEPSYRAREKDAPRVFFDSPCAVAAATAPRVAVLLMSAFVLAACAPTIHLDGPAMPTLEMPPATTQCTKEPVKTLAPLDAPPQLPDAEQSPCPAGSGLAACFTLDQDLIRQQRFKILHDDRDYCRDAYERAVTRSGGSGLTRGDGGAVTRGDGSAVK